MPNITGVLETSLYVADVEVARRFYETLFGFETLIADTRFCAMNVEKRQVLLLFRKGASLQPLQFPGGILPPHDGDGNLHLAFSIDAEEFEPWGERLKSLGIAIESEVRWPRGGRSIYFRDPDQHVIELVTPGCWATY